MKETFVWYLGAPRRVKERKVSEGNGEDFYILHPSSELGEKLSAPLCSECDLLSTDESLLMRDVVTLSDEELERRLEVAKNIKMVVSDSTKKEKSSKKKGKTKEEKLQLTTKMEDLLGI